MTTAKPSARDVSCGFLVFACVFLACLTACKGTKQSGGAASDRGADRYSFESHLERDGQSYDLFTEGTGSIRSLTIIRTEGGASDTTREQIDGAVLNAFCTDLDRDSIPEICILVQSAGSGSYGSLVGYQYDKHGRRPFSLPELDKRLAAGYLGHDTLWVQDTLLIRRFPVYTESDFNASASGGTRTLEYILQHDQSGAPYLECIRTTNNQPGH